MSESTLSITIRTIDRATTGFSKISSNLSKMSKVANRVGKSMTANLTFPILAIGAASTKAMANFESGMSNVSTLVDTTTESMDAMGKSVLEIARRTPVPIEELTKGLYDVRSAGVTAGSAMEVLEKSSQLAIAGLGTTAEATDLVTSAMNSFSMSSEESGKLYDNIFKTIKNGKTDISQLSSGFGSVATVVAATGTRFDEYLASVAAITTAGVPASQAHTKMGAAISGLTRKTRETSAVFKKLGAKDFKDLIKQSGGIVPAFEKISEAIGGNEAQLLKLVGSTEAMGAITMLTGQVNSSFVSTLDDMRIGTNAVDAAFEKQSKTSVATWQKTKNSLNSAAVSIGKILAPALAKIADKLQQASTWWEDLDDSTKEWIVTIAGVVAVVGPSLVVFAKLSSAIGTIKDVIEDVAALAMKNPIAALAAVIGLAAIHVYRNWEDFEQFFALIWDGVKSVFSDAWDFIKGIVDRIMAQVDRVITAAKDVKAHLSGDMTSGELADEEANNAKIREEFAARIFAKQNASDGAVRAMQQRQVQSSSTLDAAKQAPLKNEITLTIEGAPARVKSMHGPAAVDVKTGFQAAY